MAAYFPILRGKRFELLALRDIAVHLGQWQNITPIIEPVRESALTTEFARAVSDLAHNGVEFGVVLDPGVGDLSSPAGVDQLADALADLAAGDDEIGAHMRLVVAFGPQSHHERALAAIASRRVLGNLPSVLLVTESVDVDGLGVDFAAMRAATVIAPARRIVTRLARRAGGDPRQVIFGDPFPRLQTNLGYVGRGESIFTEEHLYLADEGLGGFADYGTIGAKYSEGGGAPRVVVIHWTYTKPTEPDETGSPIYLRHFWSDPDDLRDIAAKYAVASQDLLAFASAAALPDNPGLAALRDYASREAFPGLGMLKKLSILNHLHVAEDALSAAGL